MNAPRFSQLLVIFATLLTLPTDASGVELQRATNRAITNSASHFAELFQGIDANLIEVKFIPQNASKANVLLRNNTDQVLHIQLPDAFAAVPVLAQFGQPGGFQNNAGMDGLLGGQQGGGATQGVGGGINAGQGQGLGQGQGQGFGQGMQPGGMMRIPPGKTRKLKATTVCLEHGKPEPNPRLAYRIIPIDQFTKDKRVAQVCSRLARGEISQDTAQAAAWHLANGLDWNRLARVNRIESRYLGKIPYFTATDLEKAKSLVASMSETTNSDGQYISESVAADQ